jgi:hypothetical protein
MDAEDMTPRTGEVERTRKPEPRAKQEARVENTKKIMLITRYEFYLIFSVSFVFSVVHHTYCHIQFAQGITPWRPHKQS